MHPGSIHGSRGSRPDAGHDITPTADHGARLAHGLDCASRIYLFTFGWCMLSTLFPPTNAEAWVVAHSLAGTGQPLLLALTCSVAQCLAYTLYFFFGAVLVNRLPRVRRKLETFDVERYRGAGYSLAAVAATVGVPPAVMLAFVARGLNFRYLPFISVTFVGRIVRFVLLAHLPDLFRRLGCNLDLPA